jgi:hypothetical protein
MMGGSISLLLKLRGFHMSFKTWSAAQGAPGKDQADNKAETAPAVAEPAVQPDKMPETLPVQGPPVRKS